MPQPWPFILAFFPKYNAVVHLLSHVQLQHDRLPCPSLSPKVCSDSCPLSQWCHPTVSSFVIPFSFCPQSFPASGSFPMSWLFASGGQSIWVSASVLPVNIQDWFPLGWTGWISLQSKGLSRQSPRPGSPTRMGRVPDEAGSHDGGDIATADGSHASCGGSVFRADSVLFSWHLFPS